MHCWINNWPTSPGLTSSIFDSWFHINALSHHQLQLKIHHRFTHHRFNQNRYHPLRLHRVNLQTHHPSTLRRCRTKWSKCWQLTWLQPWKRLTNVHHNFSHQHKHPRQQLHLLTTNIHLQAINIQPQPIRHGALVLYIVIENLTGTTNVPSVRRSPRRRPRSRDLSRRRHHESPSCRDRESSVTLRSVTPDRRSPSLDFNQDDRIHHGSAGRSSRPPEPSNPPAWHHSQHQSHGSSSSDAHQGHL